MIIENQNLSETLFNVIKFAIQFLIENLGWIAILCLFIYFGGIIFRTLTFQKN